MKDLSFFFLKKHFLASRMRGRGPRSGFASSCGGDGSTSTLNQHQNTDVRQYITPDNTPFGGGSPRTLEDMILQLEVEEDKILFEELCYVNLITALLITVTTMMIISSR